MNAATTLLASGLARHADKVAYVCEGESVTFRGLDELSSRFGSALLAAGASPGDRAVLVLPDGIAYVAAFLGCLKAGVWPALVSTSLDRESCEAILGDSAARILVGDPSLAAWSAESCDLAFRLPLTPDFLRAFLASGEPGLAARAARDDDPAFLLYTSGTTGEPKGVIHAHGAAAITAEAFGNGVLGLTSEDVVFSASKLFFAYGLGNSLSFPLCAGATTILHPGKVTPGELVRILETHRPTVVSAVPSLYNLVLKFVEKVGPLAGPRLWVSAGEALSAPLVKAWMDLTGAPVIDGIGTTEALHIFLSNRPDAVRPGSSGTPVPGYEVRIVDDEGRDVSAGTPGHLLVRGGSVAKGYWRRDGKPAAVADAAGWLRTGDVYVEEDGVFFHRGRSDDLMKVDALWVSPVVVEGVLYEHPSVEECAVTGVKVWGSIRVGAHVVLRDGVRDSGETVETLREHVRSRLPAHMVPARITFCRELPKTSTGKIQRFRLRETSG